MKIKCPYCKHVYDPEAENNQCPSCSKKLLVPAFKRPAKPAAGTPAKPAEAPVKRTSPTAQAAVRIKSLETKPETGALEAKPSAPPAKPAATPPKGQPAAQPRELVISTRKVGAEKFDTVVRIPLSTARTSLLVADYIKRLIQAAGLKYDDLCRTAEESAGVGGLVEIKTKTDTVRLAIEYQA